MRDPLPPSGVPTSTPAEEDTFGAFLLTQTQALSSPFDIAAFEQLWPVCTTTSSTLDERSTSSSATLVDLAPSSAPLSPVDAGWNPFLVSRDGSTVAEPVEDAWMYEGGSIGELLDDPTPFMVGDDDDSGVWIHGIEQPAAPANFLAQYQLPSLDASCMELPADFVVGHLCHVSPDGLMVDSLARSLAGQDVFAMMMLSPSPSACEVPSARYQAGCAPSEPAPSPPPSPLMMLVTTTPMDDVSSPSLISPTDAAPAGPLTPMPDTEVPPPTVETRLVIIHESGSRSYMRSSPVDRPRFVVQLIPGSDGAVGVDGPVTPHSAALDDITSTSCHSDHPHHLAAPLVNEPFLLDATTGSAACELVFSERATGTAVQCAYFSVPVRYADGSVRILTSAPSGPFVMRTNISQFLRSEGALLQRLAFGQECVALPLVSNAAASPIPTPVSLSADAPDLTAPVSACVSAIGHQLVAITGRALAPHEETALAHLMMAVAAAPNTVADGVSEVQLSARALVGAFFAPFWGRVLRYLNNRHMRKLFAEHRVFLGFATRRHAALALAHRPSGTFALVWLVAVADPEQDGAVTPTGASCLQLPHRVYSGVTVAVPVPELTLAVVQPDCSVSFTPLTPADMDQMPLRELIVRNPALSEMLISAAERADEPLAVVSREQALLLMVPTKFRERMNSTKLEKLSQTGELR